MQIAAKIKLFIATYREELGVSAIIVLVAFSSFYLGKSSVSGSSASGHEEIAVEQADLQVGQGGIVGLEGASVPSERQDDIVASKNGKRYYYPWCSGISKISPANIVRFKSAAEAEKFGLTLATNCTPRN